MSTPETPQVSGLVEQLKEAIDADERLALAAIRVGVTPPPQQSESGEWTAVGMQSPYDARVDDHIARHDPARTLAMVAAHRELLAKHAEVLARHPAPAGKANDLVIELNALYTAIELLARGYGIEVQ
jgi:hypothetical protein